MAGQTMTAREMYQAYLRGEVTTDEIDKRATEINEARRAAAAEGKPPRTGD